MAGYIVTDPSSVIITHLTEIIKQHAHELLTRQEAQALIDNLKEHNRAVVDELLPNLMSLGEVQKVLQNLLRERVSIRDLGTILETLADWAPRTKDADQLTEYARAGLARQICKQHCDDEGVLHVFTLAPSLEQTIREGVQMTAGGLSLALEPRLASAVVSGASAQAERASEQGYGPVLLCSSQVRLAMRRLTERSVPSLAVLAYSEIVANTDIRGIGTVEIGTADRAEVAA